MGECLYYCHSGGKGRAISEVEACLVCIASFRAPRATQSDLFSKTNIQRKYLNAHLMKDRVLGVKYIESRFI